jgi:hypothetical protein
MTPPRITCTVRAALEASGLGRTKLNELLASGRLESVKIDGRRLIIWASLQKLLVPIRVRDATSDEQKRTIPNMASREK